MSATRRKRALARAALLAALGGILITAAPGQARPREVVGYFWAPDGDTSPYWTLADHSKSFSAIAPTWLSYDASGALSVKADPRLLRFAHARGLKVTPLVANAPFKPETARPVFQDDAAIARNVARLLQVVKDLGADGLNVDIEGVAPGDRPRYNAFIEALCRAFHAEKLLVTAAVPAKTADAPTGAWAGFADYAFLGRHLDQVQLMCYDEHWSGGAPGPIASLPWVRRVLEYAVSVMPRDKIVMGMPFYGYDWPPEGTASEVTGVKARELLVKRGQTPMWDDMARTAWFRYNDDDGRERTVYYETARTLEERLKLAREFRVAGVAIWRLGDEAPDFWRPLQRYRAGR